MNQTVRFAGLLPWIVAVFLSVPSLAAETEAATPVVTSALTDHPKYRQYHFGVDEQVVDLGVQPLWQPAGLVSEVMKRDQILRQAFLRQGKSIRFHSFLKGSDVNSFLHQGVLEGGFGGDMPAIAACLSDQARSVSLADLHFTAIVARKPLLISDLGGRRIGYAFSSNAHYALLTALSAAGLSESDVTLVPMNVDAMPQALQRGEIDAFSAWEPTPTIATTLYGQTVVHQFLSTGYMYFSPSFADQHPDLVSSLVAAQARALNWLEQSDVNLDRAVGWLEQAIRALVDHDFELPRQDTMQLARQSLRNLGLMPVIPKDDLLEDGRIGRAVRFLSSIGKAPPDLRWPTVRDCFRREVGVAVLAAPVKNRLHQFSYEEIGE